EDGRGVSGLVAGFVQKRAGGKVPSGDRITLLRDADGDGVDETKMPCITPRRSPFGMALLGRDLYVANTDAVLHFQYATGSTQLIEPGETVFELPAGGGETHLDT